MSTRLCEAAERIAAACERSAAALEGDAEMQGSLAAALGGPTMGVDAYGDKPISPADLEWLNGRDGGYTVRDLETGERRAASDAEAAAIAGSIAPRAARRGR